MAPARIVPTPSPAGSAGAVAMGCHEPGEALGACSGDGERSEAAHLAVPRPATWGRTEPSTRRTLFRRGDAERFVAGVEVDKLQDEWVDPGLARMTFAEWVEKLQAPEGRLRTPT